MLALRRNLGYGVEPMGTTTTDTELVSTKTAAEIAGLSVATINRWVREGRLTPIAEADGIRGARFYRRSDVEALV